MKEDEARELLAEEVNKTRGADQKPLAASVFANPAFAPYVRAMQRAHLRGSSKEAAKAAGLI